MNFKPALLLAAASLISFGAHAENETEIAPFAQWNFNANTPKASLSNGGARLTLVGLSNAPTYPNQSANGGSSDTASVSSGGSFSTNGYSGCASLSCGVQFSIDTTGYENLVFLFDQRNSATAPAHIALMYTLDNVSWTQAATFQSSTVNFYNERSFDFSGISGANNNELFGIRLLATYAAGASSYIQTSGSNPVAASGTIRYDMVTLSGSMIPDVTTPVPEASTTAMLLAGLGLVGLVARRRRAD